MLLLSLSAMAVCLICVPFAVTHRMRLLLLSLSLSCVSASSFIWSSSRKQQPKKRKQNRQLQPQPPLEPISFLFKKKSFHILFQTLFGVWCIILDWVASPNKGKKETIRARRRGKHTHTLFRLRWLNFASLKLIVCFSFFFYPYGKKKVQVCSNVRTHTHTHTTRVSCSVIEFGSFHFELFMIPPEVVGAESSQVGRSGVIVAWLNSTASFSLCPFVSYILFSSLFSLNCAPPCSFAFD
jgi:hypothetical protein